MSSVLAHEVNELTNSSAKDGFVDAGFERLVRILETRIQCTREALSLRIPQHLLGDIFKDLSLQVRGAKTDFARVARIYGPTYSRCANRFVDLVQIASELSEFVDLPEVQEDLRRHADEVAELHSQMMTA